MGKEGGWGVKLWRNFPSTYSKSPFFRVAVSVDIGTNGLKFLFFHQNKSTRTYWEKFEQAGRGITFFVTLVFFSGSMRTSTRDPPNIVDANLVILQHWRCTLLKMLISICLSSLSEIVLGLVVPSPGGRGECNEQQNPTKRKNSHQNLKDFPRFFDKDCSLIFMCPQPRTVPKNTEMYLIFTQRTWFFFLPWAHDNFNYFFKNFYFWKIKRKYPFI